MQNKKVVHEFMKNATERVKVKLSTFKERDLLDIRVYYNPDEVEDVWRPSKKGITMRFDLIPEMKKAIDKAYDVWQDQNRKNKNN